MNNLEKSELVIAKILGLLVEWGLSESSLEFEELGLDEDFRPFFATCIRWLISENIIRAKNVQEFSGGAYVSGPVLTSKGLELMGRNLLVGDATVSVGEAVQKTAKDSSYFTGAGEVAGGFVGGLFKSLGNG